MTLVYGQEAADAFFALLDDTLALDVSYTHPKPTLEAAITDVDSGIAYDDFRHRLSHTGILSTATCDALKAVVDVTQTFRDAVDALLDYGEAAKGSFFTRYPELEPRYTEYVTSGGTVADKRKALLAAFQPELARRRKHQQALQRLSAAVSVDLAFSQAVLDPPAPPYPLRGGIGTLQDGVLR